MERKEPTTIKNKRVIKKILNPKFEILNSKRNSKYQKPTSTAGRRSGDQKSKTKIKDEKIKLEFLNCSVICL